VIKKTLASAAAAIFVSFTAISFAAGPDDIEYDTVYECGGQKSKFKVLSCNGNDGFDRCEVFYINELSPGGGNKVSTYRSGIEEDIANGCKTKSGKAGPVKPRSKPAENFPPVKSQTAGTVACFASDSDAAIKNANERNFRGVIRRLWEKDAAKGADGAVTLNYQSFVVGASRRWRPTASDAYSQVDPRKPIYAVRASFETCTDYRSAITKRKMERIYDCFTHKAGGLQCTQTGASGALALKDKEEYIQKRR
jgi:hypothetical protein